MDKHKYTTTYGKELSVEPVSPLLLQKVQIALAEEFEREGVSLKAPQYCVELPGGGSQCFEYDQESIDGNGTPQEDKDAWKLYLSNVNKFNGDLTERMLGVIIMDQKIDFDDGWEEKLKWLGIEIPKNEFDKKVLYMTTLVLKTIDDIQGYMKAVINVSMNGASEDAVEAAKSMFSGKA